MTEEVLNRMGMAERETRAQFERLVGLYGPAISRTARSYAKTVHEREDLEQNIGLALWQALPTFRGDCSERTFVLRIAHNQALSHLTRRRARPVEDAIDEDAPTGELDPEALAGLNQEMRAVFRAMHALPVNQRQVLALALEGLSLGFGGAYAILAGIFFYAGHKLRRFQREAEDLSRQIAELEP